MPTLIIKSPNMTTEVTFNKERDDLVLVEHGAYMSHGHVNDIKGCEVCEVLGITLK